MSADITTLQRRLGVKPDGIFGPQSIAATNRLLDALDSLIAAGRHSERAGRPKLSLKAPRATEPETGAGGDPGGSQ